MSPETDKRNTPPPNSEKKGKKSRKLRRKLVKKFLDEKSVLDESNSPSLSSKKKTPSSLKPKKKSMKKSLNGKNKLGESSSALSTLKKKTLASPNSKGEIVKKSSNKKPVSSNSKETENPQNLVKKSSDKIPVSSNSKETQNSQNLVKKPNKKTKPVNNQNNKPDATIKGSHSGKEKEVENSSKFHSRNNSMKKLGGFIFMCNAKTKPDCYQYRVMGVQAHKKDQVMGVKPGMKLFLFDIDVKLLYGIYKATSGGGMRLEPAAFGGGFPLQVRFEVHKDCLPLPESVFRKAIKESYDEKTRKFKTELTLDQVNKLTNLFKPALILHSNPQPVVHEPKPTVAPIGPPAYDPYRPGLEREGAHTDAVFINRPEQETVQLVKPTLTSPPVLLTEQEYRSYGLRGDRPPPIHDPYIPDQARGGSHPDPVYLNRPYEQESSQSMRLLNSTLTSPPVLLTEQEYRNYGLRGDRPPPVHDPYIPDQARGGTYPDTVNLNRPYEQESSQRMRLLNPTLTSSLTEQGYRSYGVIPPPAYDPYKTDQEIKYSQAPRDALFLSEKDYRVYGLKSRQENPTSFTSNIDSTNHNPAVGFHQPVQYNPYDQDSDLVERYLPHHVAPPSSSYRFAPETVLSERVYPGNASNEPSNYNQDVGQRIDDFEYKSAPVSSRYAFAGPSVFHR